MDFGAASPAVEMAFVLFMDLVDYSLQTIDRQSERLTRLQGFVQQSPEYQAALRAKGVIALPTGDGMALVFMRDALSPVKCALEVAVALSAHSDIKLRMGVHMGPVRRHGDITEQVNVVGSGVNIAQRVMDFGDAGHILVSGAIAEVLDQLGEWRDCLEDLGTHEVKHGVQLRFYNLCKDGLGNPELPRRVGKRPAVEGSALHREQPSIAILPFVDMSQEQDQQWFSDGLTEEIINTLTRVPDLKVIARSSAFFFRGKDRDVRGIAKALGVRSVLEGSIRRAGSRLRMTAQLINAEDGFHLWSERYDREMTDVFGLQDEVATAIGEALRLRLLARPARTRKYQPKLPAYEARLKAKHHLWQPSPESLEKARDYYEQAIGLDPGYARAHLELGAYFGQIATVGFMPAHKALPLAREAMRRAMGLSEPSEQPVIHAALAAWAGVYDYDWKEAERLFRIARTQESPEPVHRFLYASSFLLSMGHAQEAVAELELALEGDPLNTWWRTIFAYALFSAGRFADAAAELYRVLELDPNSHQAYFYLAGVQASRGKYARAWSCARKAWKLAPLAPLNIALRAAGLRRVGRRGAARKLLAGLPGADVCQVPIAHMLYHLICSEIDQAADWAEKAIAEREPKIIGFLRSPVAKDLRASPRWTAIARMMNLQP